MRGPRTLKQTTTQCLNSLLLYSSNTDGHYQFFHLTLCHNISVKEACELGEILIRFDIQIVWTNFFSHLSGPLGVHGQDLKTNCAMSPQINRHDPSGL